MFNRFRHQVPSDVEQNAEPVAEFLVVQNIHRHVIAKGNEGQLAAIGIDRLIIEYLGGNRPVLRERTADKVRIAFARNDALKIASQSGHAI